MRLRTARRSRPLVPEACRRRAQKGGRARHAGMSRMRAHCSSRRTWKQFAQNWRESFGWARCTSRLTSHDACVRLSALNDAPESRGFDGQDRRGTG